MPIKTKFTEICGVTVPLMCGGMHFVGYAELAAAVSNAGGLGTITALTQPSAEALRAEIRKCKTLTKKPFGVNLTLLPSLVPPDYDAYAKVVVDEGIKIVETAGRNPEKFIKFFKDHNCIVIHKCVAIKHAETAARHGATFVSMDGYECGGHPGENDVTNWVLFAKAARKLKIPYIASGSCGDGKQLAAALALGCEGMNMGTRWMATKEANVHQNIKQAIVDANEYDTTLVMKSLQNTERVFKNKTAKELQEVEREFPGDLDKILPFVKGMKYKQSFQETGNTQDSIWSCGQVIGLIDDIPTVQELVNRIVSEAESVISGRLSSMIVSKL